MTILVVGYGLIGAQRVQALTDNRQVEKIVVYDPKLEPGQHLFPQVLSISEGEAFGGRFDAVLVATPHDVAATILPQVVRRTGFVLAEKPLGRAFREAEQLAAFATQANTRLFVGLNYRFLRNIQWLRGALRQGDLGEVLAVDAVLGHGAAPGYENSWKTDQRRCGGGVCIDPGVHVFDLLRWLFGRIEVVGGARGQSFWKTEVEDHASVSFSLPNGAIANVFLSISSWQSRFELTVELQNAQILVRGRGKYYGPQTVTFVRKWPWGEPDTPRETQFNFGTEDSSLRQETAEFVNIVSGKQDATCLATATDALEAMRVVDSCYHVLSVLGRGMGAS